MVTDRTTGAETEGPEKRLWRAALRKLIKGTGVLVTAGIAMGLIGLGTLVIQERADARPEPVTQPSLSVTTIIAQEVSHFTRKERYIGVLEPSREASLAFELPGTLTKIHVDEGDQVVAGDVIATLDTRLLETQQNELKARRNALGAQLSLAEVTTERQRNLSRDGWSTEQAFDEARFDVERLQAAIAEVDAALQSNRVNLDKSVITAPFSGMIAARHLDEGSIVTAGAAIADIMEASAPQVRIGLPQRLRSVVSQDQTHQIVLEGQTFDATFSAIRPDINPATRSVIALFDLETEAPPPFGALAHLVLEIEESASGFWLPLTALRESARGLWTVLTVIDDTVQTESVEVLHAETERVFVRGTLQDGAHVIAQGNHRLVPGLTVVSSTVDRAGGE